MKTSWLGRISYGEALTLQERTVALRLDGEGEDALLLMEHDPVYTIGRTPDQTSLRGGNRLPHAIVQTNRGGQATYHGPGQLIGYPILDLRELGQDLHTYLRAIEEALIVALESCGVAGVRRDGLTGVWVGPRKIASIGVGVRRWISMHGFALNVCGDLSPFSHITPCGIAGVEMTSIARECGAGIEVEAAGHLVSESLAAQFARLRLQASHVSTSGRSAEAR